MTWKRCYYWNSWGKLDGKLIRRFEMTSGRWRVIHRLACEALLVVAMIQVCLNAMECKNELPCSTWHHRVLPGDWMRARCRWLNETTHWERRQCDIKVRWWHDDRWYDDMMNDDMMTWWWQCDGMAEIIWYLDDTLSDISADASANPASHMKHQKILNMNMWTR